MHAYLLSVINQHLLWDLMSVDSGTLTRHLVHPTSPVLLTKNGPLEAPAFCARLNSFTELLGQTTVNAIIEVFKNQSVFLTHSVISKQICHCALMLGTQGNCNLQFPVLWCLSLCRLVWRGGEYITLSTALPRWIRLS